MPLVTYYLFLLFWIMSSPIAWLYMDHLNPGHCVTQAFKLYDIGGGDVDSLQQQLNHHHMHEDDHHTDKVNGDSRHDLESDSKTEWKNHVPLKAATDGHVQGSKDFTDYSDESETIKVDRNDETVDLDLIDTRIDYDPLIEPVIESRRTQNHRFRHNDKHVKLHTHPRKQNLNKKKSQDEHKKNLLSILIEMQKLKDTQENIQHTKEEEKEVDLFYEDDIMLTKSQAELLLHDIQQETDEHRKRRKRKLAEPMAKRWKLPIPYTFDGNHSPKEKFRIEQALSYWEELTCIRFKEDPIAQHKLMFNRGRGFQIIYLRSDGAVMDYNIFREEMLSQLKKYEDSLPK